MRVLVPFGVPKTTGVMTIRLLVRCPCAAQSEIVNVASIPCARSVVPSAVRSKLTIA